MAKFEVVTGGAGQEANDYDGVYLEGYAPPFSEEGMALSFAAEYAGRLRYVKPWNAWMHWDGTRWAREDTLLVYDLIRKQCRLAAASLLSASNVPAEKKGGIASALSKAKMRASIETLLRSDRRLAATTSQWDADNWVLNTPGGAIDLRTGKNLGCDPVAYCTKITAATPGGNCPLWGKFIQEVTGDDAELQAFLKRMCGYFLTGSIREHALFFVYGPGGNGKSVFVDAISAVLGDYHVRSPAETFAEQKSPRHETEHARLHQARLVVAQETTQGQYWAEGRIKSLTGGDRIPARFMRSDYFEYDPKFKLCVAGNNKPQLRVVDDAIRRRLHLILFDLRIPAEKKDKTLPAKLKAEYPGILQWMIEGCLEWQQQGLNPPASVVAATDDYLASEDTIGSWLGEETTKAGSARASLTELFVSWKAYADANNFAARNNKFLSEQLVNRGYGKEKTNQGVIFSGLCLNGTLKV